MNRGESIQRAVWALLSLVEQPADAVATAQAQVNDADLKPVEFRSIMRAAGAFARDEEGYFVRYRHGGAIRPLVLPTPTHILSLPVPAEPRMRIAYSVFTGLLLKYLYQRHDVVPISVTDGLAQIWCPHDLPATSELWRDFRASSIAENAIADGIEASLNALPRPIGALPLTDTLGHSAVWKTVRRVIPNKLTTNTFQTQGGKRPSFYWRKEALEGIRAEPLEETVITYLQGHLTLGEAAKAIATTLLNKEEDGILENKNLWQAWKDCFKSLPTGETKGEKDRVKELRERGWRLHLGRLRRNAADLQRFVIRHCSQDPVFERLVAQALSIISQTTTDAKVKNRQLDSTQLLNAIEDAFIQKALASNHPRHRYQSLQLALKTTLIATLAKRLPDAPEGHRFTLEGWPADLLVDLKPADAHVLTLLEFTSSGGRSRALVSFTVDEGGKKPNVISKVALEPLPELTSPAPFTLCETGAVATYSQTEDVGIGSGTRCIICGSCQELLNGTKVFLPESKKRYYEQPQKKDNPKICSACAFIAYLSSIYPHEEMSIVEFPADNYLELFALHEALQGVSGLQALKVINRVANLSIFPNHYLLLSLRSGQGKIDTKTQVYLQLKEQTHLLKQQRCSMRVHVAGSQAHAWTEIHPFVAVGLGHFRGLPHYMSTDGASKGAAYDIVNALASGLVYTALYRAIRFAQKRLGEKDVRERDVLEKGVANYETYYVQPYHITLTKAAGGVQMNKDMYKDVIAFSNELFAITLPLVRHEVNKSGSNVSVVARKYTNLVEEEFSEGLAARFLYAVAQEADAADRKDDWWVKRDAFKSLYGAEPPKGSGEQAAKAWGQFRDDHPKTQLELNLEHYYAKYGSKAQNWTVFLREVQLRTLSLLLLNVRQKRQS